MTNWLGLCDINFAAAEIECLLSQFANPIKIIINQKERMSKLCEMLQD